MRYLLDHFEGVCRMPMIGASAGALVTTLTACSVPPERTVLSAYRLGLEYDLWERPLGLAGVWGDLLRDWLKELLPEDAHVHCSHRTTLAVTRLPSMAVCGFDSFSDKEDLIEAVMASVHVPFVLDFKPWARFRGERAMDGSVVEFLSGGKVASYMPFFDPKTQTGLDLDYFHDEELQWNSADFITLRTYEEVVMLYAQGYECARRMDLEGRSGVFAHLTRREKPLQHGRPDTVGLLREGEKIRRAMEEGKRKGEKVL